MISGAHCNSFNNCQICFYQNFYLKKTFAEICNNVFIPIYPPPLIYPHRTAGRSSIFTSIGSFLKDTEYAFFLIQRIFLQTLNRFDLLVSPCIYMYIYICMYYVLHSHDTDVSVRVLP